MAQRTTLGRRHQLLSACRSARARTPHPSVPDDRTDWRWVFMYIDRISLFDRYTYTSIVDRFTKAIKAYLHTLSFTFCLTMYGREPQRRPHFHTLPHFHILSHTLSHFRTFTFSHFVSHFHTFTLPHFPTHFHIT